MYQSSAPSFNVPSTSLHFRESKAPTIAIWLLIDTMCSWGSLFPSKDGKGSGLYFSWTWSPQIVYDKGWGSRSSFSSSSSLVFCDSCSVWTLSCRDSVYWCRFSIIDKSCAMFGRVWGSLLLGGDSEIVFLWWNVWFYEALESFMKAPWWAPNVPDKYYLDKSPWS